jgi:hypothetical protein
MKADGLQPRVSYAHAAEAERRRAPEGPVPSTPKLALESFALDSLAVDSLVLEPGPNSPLWGRVRVIYAPGAEPRARRTGGPRWPSRTFETRWVRHVKSRYGWLLVFVQTSAAWTLLAILLLLLRAERRRRDLERLARLRARDPGEDGTWWTPSLPP